MPSTVTSRQAPRSRFATSFCCGWAEIERQKRSGRRMRSGFMERKYIPWVADSLLVDHAWRDDRRLDQLGGEAGFSTPLRCGRNDGSLADLHKNPAGPSTPQFAKCANCFAQDDMFIGRRV